MKRIIMAVLASMVAWSPAEARPPRRHDAQLVLMAVTIYCEARSDGVHGMRAVAHVIRNRMRAQGGTVADVVLAPYQFTVWNKGGPARGKVPRADDPTFKEALEVARMVLAGESRDTTHGATFYFERSIKPSWRKGMVTTAVIGRHIYLRPRSK